MTFQYAGKIASATVLALVMLSGCKSKKDAAIDQASHARIEAETAQGAYAAALAQARSRANGIVEETRQKLNAEIARAKAEADAKAHDAVTAAEARIAQTRESAKLAVRTAARDAAIAIVERLTGDKVSTDDAAQAMGN